MSLTVSVSVNCLRLRHRDDAGVEDLARTCAHLGTVSRQSDFPRVQAREIEVQTLIAAVSDSCCSFDAWSCSGVALRNLRPQPAVIAVEAARLLNSGCHVCDGPFDVYITLLESPSHCCTCTRCEPASSCLLRLEACFGSSCTLHDLHAKSAQCISRSTHSRNMVCLAACRTSQA